MSDDRAKWCSSISSNSESVQSSVWSSMLICKDVVLEMALLNGSVAKSPDEEEDKESLDQDAAF